MSSKLKTNLTEDDPLKLDANYKFTKDDRRYIDDQNLAAQQHIVDSLISGFHATWFYLAGTSAAVATGDVVVASSDPNNNSGIPTVTKATSADLATAGAAAGIVIAGATPASRVKVAISGIIPASITGLSSAGLARVNTTTGRPELVSSLGTLDYALGAVHSTGNLTLTGTSKGGGGSSNQKRIFNVRDYGATSNDFTHDSHSSIVAAVAAATTGNQIAEVHFPTDSSNAIATYYTFQPIWLQQPCRITGTNRGSVTILGEFFHGPTIVSAPAALGTYPTTTALLTGTGNALQVAGSATEYLKLSDMLALRRAKWNGQTGLHNLTAFSVDCAVKPTVTLPGSSYGFIAVSCGNSMFDATVQSAFYLALFNGGHTNLDLAGQMCINGTLYPITLPNVVPVNSVTYVQMTFDGSTIRLFAGPPGSTTTTTSVSAAGTVTQSWYEEVYLGQYGGGWPVVNPIYCSFTGSIDSPQLSKSARNVANFTAPTAKPAGDANTLLLVTNDQDRDIWTIGKTWINGQQEPVYLMHRKSVVLIGAVPIDIEDVSVGAYDGHAIHSYGGIRTSVRNVSTVDLSPGTYSSGVVFEDNAYFGRVDNLESNNSGLFGLACIATSGLERIVGYKTLGACKFDLVGSAALDVQAAYFSSGSSVIPIYIDNVGGNAGATFSLRGFGTESENVAVSDTTVSDGAMTSGLPTLTCATSHPFTAASVGYPIRVSGAGAAGADLVTTISAFTSTSVVTLAANAGGSVSGKTVVFGPGYWPAVAAFRNVRHVHISDFGLQPVSVTISQPPGIYVVSPEASPTQLVLDNVEFQLAPNSKSCVSFLGDIPKSLPVLLRGTSLNGTPLVDDTTTAYNARIVDSDLEATTLSIALSDADTTLTSAQWRSGNLIFTGTLTAGRIVYLPKFQGYRRGVFNQTNQTLYFVPRDGGTIVVVASGAGAMIASDANGNPLAGPGATAFSPTTSLSGNVYALQAGNGITLSGSNVTAWADTSGAGHPSANGTASFYPTYNTADAQYGGYNTLSFTTAQYLETAAWTVPSPTTIFVVGHTVDNGITSVFFSEGVSLNQLNDAVSGGIEFYDGTMLSTGVNSVNTPRVIGVVSNGGSSAIYVSRRTANVTGAAGGPAVGTFLTVGSNAGHANGVNGKLAELHIFNRVLTVEEITLMELYLGGKFGITIA